MKDEPKKKSNVTVNITSADYEFLCEESTGFELVGSVLSRLFTELKELRNKNNSLTGSDRQG